MPRPQAIERFHAPIPAPDLPCARVRRVGGRGFRVVSRPRLTFDPPR